MSSAQKTDFLSLNKWISTDIPKREDFNYDNSTIDNAFKTHTNDMEKHISSAERSEWSEPHFIGFYYGNGSSTIRVIDTECSFDPSFAIVFAGGSPPGVTDFTSKLHRNRFAFLTKRSSNTGISLSGKNIVLASSGTTAESSETIEYNRSGGLYCYILFR
ncbi:MAG: hypothetical protein K2F65_06705 [Eubacterium sp.]|nr:hypothetical protein [Eubacterium sp.]